MLKPKLFIGSSSEGVKIAKALQQLLAEVADVRPWTDVFQLGDTTIATLLREVNLCDYAILVVLLRLGLRAGEAAALELDDIDWRRGELVVRGKIAARHQ